MSRFKNNKKKRSLKDVQTVSLNFALERHSSDSL